MTNLNTGTVVFCEGLQNVSLHIRSNLPEVELFRYPLQIVDGEREVGWKRNGVGNGDRR